ncbi:Kef-type K+ ransport system, predicted NAD-binding component [Belliella baltica DSM 15883]|uniref:Kef-type K+ ransport system, predicted NAD-binding component n=1 Tax=Belliella baltica (strain DSM 15883 / CIP 108006 / LMG 21964 / BA134) TaxID=866536 RepID=I3Z2F6_BELBD|nr:ion transporter [Belliella baltica]AFL83424.1 Kef-type K+ ransport system, predicted NAD-binding component [Belliella baltica DSM 15883]
MSLFPSKSRLAHIVFEHDDEASKNFDLIILVMIMASLVVVILDSEPSLYAKYHNEFLILEWILTGLFTVEYIGRIWLSKKKLGYIFSFYGIVDLLAIIPSYLSLFLVGTQFFVVIRALRFLRVVRILKLGRYMKEAEVLKTALKSSRPKIQLFLGTVLTIVLITGTLMFIVEGPENGFTSIAMSMYWAIVTLTTVGFGDITPITPLGKLLASVIMLLGYAIIAVPTGIVTSELTMASSQALKKERKTCRVCKTANQDIDSIFCKSCGERF